MICFYLLILTKENFMTKTDESTLQIHRHANDYRDLCNLAGDV